MFSNNVSYITPGCISSISIGNSFSLLSIASWAVLFSLIISPNFWVDSFVSDNFLVIGDKFPANFLSWVCFKILFLLLGVRWFFCYSANLRGIIVSCSVTFEEILI